MPRRKRSSLPDGAFHVIAHAVASELLFEDDVDRRLYLGHLQITTERYGWQVHTFALMSNHVHLLVVAKVADLSQGLWWLNWRYDVHFKRRHPTRRGHIFEARPNTIPVTDDAYLLAVLRYIARNPVKAGISRRPEDYRWSAHRAIIGLGPSLPFIDAARPLGWFGETPTARERYEAFVRGEEPPKEREVARRAERPPRDRPALEDLVEPGVDDDALRVAYQRWGYSIRQIAAAAGRDRQAVARRVV